MNANVQFNGNRLRYFFGYKNNYHQMVKIIYVFQEY